MNPLVAWRGLFRKSTGWNAEFVDSKRRRQPKVVDKAVIALPDTNRLDTFYSRPGAEGFRVAEAFDGRTGAGTDLFDVDRFVERVGREPLGGEIGCAISHFQVLQDFALTSGRGDDVLIVAEDDALLSTNFEEVLGRVLDRARDLAYVILADPYGEADRGDFFGYSEYSVRLSALATPVGPPWNPWQFRVGRYTGLAFGAGLYAVTRDAAKKYERFVAERGSLSWVADDYSHWATGAGVRVSFLRPNLASWAGGTTLGREDPRQVNEVWASRRYQGGVLTRVRSHIALRTRWDRLVAAIELALDRS